VDYEKKMIGQTISHYKILERSKYPKGGQNEKEKYGSCYNGFLLGVHK